jgi:phosphate transport system permease protein
MLPTMTRASEEILRTVPDSLREGALALGAPNWRLVQRVVLPTAIAGLLTAMLLAIARAVGETAPVLLTAFGADNTNRNPLSGPQEDLPMFVWKRIRVPFATQNDRAWTGALILCGLIFVLFASARLISTRSQRRLGRAR